MTTVRKPLSELREEPHAVKFLIDIEFLLDTRLPLIHDVNPNSLPIILKRGYHRRLSDNFAILDPHFDMVEYRKLWAERNVETLMRSTLTNFPLVLSHIVSKAVTDRESTPVPSHVFLDVNFGRYDDLPAEHYKAWIEHFSESIPAEVFVEYRFHKPEQMTPRFLNKNYQNVAIYDYANWIEMHFPTHISPDALRASAMMHTDMFFPMLLKSTVDPKEFLEAVEARGGDFFDDLGKSLAHIMYPRFMETCTVSVINPEVVEHITKSLIDMNTIRMKSE